MAKRWKKRIRADTDRERKRQRREESRVQGIVMRVAGVGSRTRPRRVTWCGRGSRRTRLSGRQHGGQHEGEQMFERDEAYDSGTSGTSPPVR